MEETHFMLLFGGTRLSFAMSFLARDYHFLEKSGFSSGRGLVAASISVDETDDPEAVTMKPACTSGFQILTHEIGGRMSPPAGQRGIDP